MVSAKKPSRLLHVLFASGMALAALGGAGEVSANPGEPSAGSKREAAAFVAELQAKGKYKAGKEGTVELTLKPKEGYKVNKLYPYKFKLAEGGGGVSFPKPLLKKDAFELDEKSARLKVPFVAGKSGKARIAGTFSMSVCSEASCVMEKVDLEVEVDVK